MDTKKLFEELQKDIAQLFILNEELSKKDNVSIHYLEHVQLKAKAIVAGYNNIIEASGYNVADFYTNNEQETSKKTEETKDVQVVPPLYKELRNMKDSYSTKIDSNKLKNNEEQINKEEEEQALEEERLKAEKEEQERQKEAELQKIREEEERKKLEEEKARKEEEEEELQKAREEEEREQREEEERKKQEDLNAVNDYIAEMEEGDKIDNLLEAIDITSRFNFITELFNGNTQSFYHTVQDIDRMSSYNEACNYINDTLDWEGESPSKASFMNMVRRRFL